MVRSEGICPQAPALQNRTFPLQVTGDPVKLGLGAVSLVFDGVMMVQHYILYGPKAAPYERLQDEGCQLESVSTAGTGTLEHLDVDEERGMKDARTSKQARPSREL